jgi:hypothetical protein
MRNARHWFVIICLLIFTLPTLVMAQNGQITLTGRALVPADMLADGPPAGQALGSRKINGIKVPFDQQPIGTITGILPGDYPGTWLILTSSQFDRPANSRDYLLRIYTVELDLRRVGGGSGEVTHFDWRNLADPDRHIQQAITNGDSPTRYLTGADFAPRAFSKASDGTFWIAESRGPSVLHFDAYGKLLQPPVSLGAGALQGMSITPDGLTLVIAQKDAGDASTVLFRTMTVSTPVVSAQALRTYKLDAASNSIGGMAMINSTQIVVIEQDAREGTVVQFKRLFLADLGAEPAAKTLIGDLMNIADPSGVSGLGATFKFPYLEIAGVYPTSEQTMVVVNNNRVPYGKARSAIADPTDYITFQLSQPLAVDSAYLRPLR